MGTSTERIRHVLPGPAIRLARGVPDAVLGALAIGEELLLPRCIVWINVNDLLSGFW